MTNFTPRGVNNWQGYELIRYTNNLCSLEEVNRLGELGEERNFNSFLARVHARERAAASMWRERIVRVYTLNLQHRIAASALSEEYESYFFSADRFPLRTFHSHAQRPRTSTAPPTTHSEND